MFETHVCAECQASNYADRLTCYRCGMALPWQARRKPGLGESTGNEEEEPNGVKVQPETELPPTI